jgi:hypothetical protein
LIGRDGMTGIAVVLGNGRSPNETFIEGQGLAISAEALREAMQQSRSLERSFLSFAHSFLNQAARTALSNGTATLEERLARWLLMANDRLGSDSVPLTHEFLSLMLGVRRAGVTVALHFLEQRGIIQLARKQIVIWIARDSRRSRMAIITSLSGCDFSPRSAASIPRRERANMGICENVDCRNCMTNAIVLKAEWIGASKSWTGSRCL